MVAIACSIAAARVHTEVSIVLWSNGHGTPCDFSVDWHLLKQRLTRRRRTVTRWRRCYPVILVIEQLGARSSTVFGRIAGAPGTCLVKGYFMFSWHCLDCLGSSFWFAMLLVIESGANLSDSFPRVYRRLTSPGLRARSTQRPTLTSTCTSWKSRCCVIVHKFRHRNRACRQMGFFSSPWSMPARILLLSTLLGALCRAGRTRTAAMRSHGFWFRI